jgi:hypothetical protein
VNFLTIFLEKFIDQILKARNKLAKFLNPKNYLIQSAQIKRKKHKINDYPLNI